MEYTYNGGQFMNKIPEAVMRRLPRYYRHLSSLENNGITRVSSKQLGESLVMTASQIRHDLNFFGGFGQQGYGDNVTELKEKLIHILGIDVSRKLVIVGAGNIGTALARHEEFGKQGYNLVALFDNKEDIIGQEINGMKVYHSDSLPEYIKENEIDIVALTVPAKYAQQIAHISQKAGAKAIWNFAPVDVVLSGAAVENIHLTDSLMTLSFRLSNK
jgi:redox-sensing transcriptional repressor